MARLRLLITLAIIAGYNGLKTVSTTHLILRRAWSGNRYAAFLAIRSLRAGIVLKRSHVDEEH